MGLVAFDLTVTDQAAESSPAGIVLRLFRAHGDAVFRLAMLMLGNPQAAEDVVQETFLRLLRHVSEGRPLSNAAGWIFTVAAHACRDQQRAARRWLPWLPERDTRPSADRPDARDESVLILDALRRLSPRDRCLLALRAQGLGYADIAEAAGLRLTSTGRIVCRAVERLERELRKSGVVS
jgi:RNA polymerase sigma-70 factor, ECF subfamily